MKKIAIIGAGISGLFIAYLFKKNSDYQVVIYEKSNSNRKRRTRTCNISTIGTIQKNIEIQGMGYE